MLHISLKQGLQVAVICVSRVFVFIAQHVHKILKKKRIIFTIEEA